MSNKEDLESRVRALEAKVNELKSVEVKSGKNGSPKRIGLGLLLIALVAIFLYSQYKLTRDQQLLLTEQNRLAEMQAGFNQFQVIQDLYKVEEDDTLGVGDLFGYLPELDIGTRRKFLERILSRESYSYLNQRSFRHYFEQIDSTSAEYFLRHAKSFGVSQMEILGQYAVSDASGKGPKLGDKGILRRMTKWYSMEHLPIGKLSFVDHHFLNSPAQGYTSHISDMLYHIVINTNIVYSEGRIGNQNLQTLPSGSFQLLKDVDALLSYIKEAAFYSPETIRAYVDMEGFEGIGNKVLFDLQDPYLTATYRNSKLGFFYLRNASEMRYNIYQTYFHKSPTEESYLKNLPFLIAFLDYEQDLRQEYIVEGAGRSDYRNYSRKLGHLIGPGYDSLKTVFDQSDFY